MKTPNLCTSFFFIKATAMCISWRDSISRPITPQVENIPLYHAARGNPMYVFISFAYFKFRHQAVKETLAQSFNFLDFSFKCPNFDYSLKS
jgi:hypothetical protein